MEATLKGLRQLKVWEKAHQLSLGVYRAAASFPRRRNLWPDQPDPPRQRFYWRESSRGLREER
jgi:hypothetical protein